MTDEEWRMKDKEWKEIRKKEEEKQLEICARCVHSIVGTNTIECGVGIMQEVCPIQFMENHKESEEENLTLDDWTYHEYPRESEEEE